MSGHAYLYPRRRSRFIKPVLVALLLVMFLAATVGALSLAYANLLDQAKAAAYEVEARSELRNAVQAVYLADALGQESYLSRGVYHYPRTGPKPGVGMVRLENDRLCVWIASRHDGTTYYLDTRTGLSTTTPCNREAS